MEDPELDLSRGQLAICNKRGLQQHGSPGSLKHVGREQKGHACLQGKWTSETARRGVMSSSCMGKEACNLVMHVGNAQGKEMGEPCICLQKKRNSWLWHSDQTQAKGMQAFARGNKIGPCRGCSCQKKKEDMRAKREAQQCPRLAC